MDKNAKNRHIAACQKLKQCCGNRDEILTKALVVFIKRVDVKPSLTSYLVSKMAITQDKYDVIEASDKNKKSEKLFNILRKRSEEDFCSFIDGLIVSGQEHVATEILEANNLVIENECTAPSKESCSNLRDEPIQEVAGRTSESGSHIKPKSMKNFEELYDVSRIKEHKKDILDENEDFFKDEIDIEHGLLSKLLATKVITRQHKESIESGQTDSQKIDKLVKILIRRNGEALIGFFQALIKSDQLHIVQETLKDYECS